MLRFSPSPTGDMQISSLRVALLNYMIAKQKNVHFIVRIEDSEKERNIEGKDTEIMQILEKFALKDDAVSHQSENLHRHQTLAIRLLEEKKAFISLCSSKDQDTDSEKAKVNDVAYRYSGKCTTIGAEALQKLKEEKTPFVIQIKTPETSIVNHDLIQGNIVTEPEELDSFVILRADNTPTNTFATACDDMISGTNFIIRSEKHLPKMPKQEYIKTLLGYEQQTVYAHLPLILNQEGQEMSEKDDQSSVKSLFREGFIPDAIANYLILMGNKTPAETFTMSEAVEWFKLENISRSPVKFDIEKLKEINREHLARMDDKMLSSLFGFADADIGKLAKVYLEEASTINTLEGKIRPVFSPKNFESEWGREMRTLEQIIFEAPMIDTFESFVCYLSEKSTLEGESLLQPLRVLLTGAEEGPDLGDIYPLIKSYLLEVAS